MKRLMTVVGAVLVSTYGFAMSTSTTPTTSIKNAASSWKTYQSQHLQNDANDLHIVYGGADISRKPTLASHTTLA